MPPLGTSLIDKDAVKMITQWINQLPADKAAIKQKTKNPKL